LNGEGSLLTVEEEVKSEEIEKQNNSIDQSSLVNAALAAKDETIAALREQIQTKDELVAALRQQIDILQKQVHAAKDEELFKDFPFPKGIADKQDTDPAHV
jgi:predicted  nucleic acid-binding Zn-ribbon protein